MKKESRLNYILTELAHHLPYSIFGVTLGIIFVAVLSFFAQIAHAEHEMAHAAEELFHVFHPAHILFSAVATTAMFWKHDDKSIVKAAAVGIVGSLSICGLSDIGFPYAGGILMGQPMGFHVCLIEEPGLVIPFAVVGVMAGFMVTKTFERSTEYSHGVHVFLSSTASILYLVSYGLTDWTHAVGGVFLVTLIAVMIPCCLSDIVFPLCCTHKHCKHSPEEGLHHV